MSYNRASRREKVIGILAMIALFVAMFWNSGGESEPPERKPGQSRDEFVAEVREWCARTYPPPARGDPPGVSGISLADCVAAHTRP